MVGPHTPCGTDEPAHAQQARLEEILRGYGSLVVAYSGGVDSAYLAVMAHRVLKDRALAVTAQSASLAPEELEDAIALARQFGFPHQVVHTHELQNPKYAANNLDRCYFCKEELMAQLQTIAGSFPGAKIALGAIVDDLGDFRPGETAAQERGAVFPLREAGLSKAAIRSLSAALGLPTAEKPAGACLASRIPFQQPVTAEKLERVARAESFLHRLGFEACRVRHHQEIARIEVPTDRLAALLAQSGRIVSALKELGFVYVTLDLQGLRSGSLHEAHPDGKSRRSST